MEHLDRIAESYTGALGRALQEKSQQRIDWICEKVQGKNVLDIGCSQGICEVLLGRRDIRVTGIDIAEESIAYARSILNNEPLEVKKNVTLVCADFLSKGDLANDYDTVLMTEVLEHLEDPTAMVVKAMSHLCNGGEVIVTVPFGINDFPDHKHTFYLADIYEMLSQWIVVDEIKFMGSWIAFYGKKSSDAKALKQIEVDLLRREEEAFFALERLLLDRIKLLAEKQKKAEENYQIMKGTVQTRNEQLDTVRKQLDVAASEKAAIQKQAEEQRQRLEEQTLLITEKYKKTEENYQSMKAVVQTRNEQLERIREQLNAAEIANADIQDRAQKQCQQMELSKNNELQVLSQAKDEAMQQAISRIYHETMTGFEKWKQMENERFQMLENSHRQALNDSRCAYDTLRDEYSQLQKELEDSRQTYNTLNNEHNRVHTELEQARQSNDALLGQYNHINEKLTSARKEYDALLEEFNHINNDLTNSQQKYDVLNLEHVRTQTELSQFKQCALQLENEKNSLQKLLDESGARNKQLTQNNINLEVQIEQLQSQLLRNIEELEKEEHLLTSVKQQILQMSSQLQQIRQQNKIYEEKLNKVYGTWYGRIVLKCYKILRKIKHLVIKK